MKHPAKKKNTSAQDLELAHVKNVGKLPLPGFFEIISSVAHESHECCDFPHDDLKQAAKCETNWGKLRENPKKKGPWKTWTYILYTQDLPKPST